MQESLPNCNQVSAPAGALGRFAFKQDTRFAFMGCRNKLNAHEGVCFKAASRVVENGKAFL